ncbi:hypothetical protein E2C01_020485 [Portunus trituberculatus]|uniref:Uncharacterized protein n=1 Tax=Portunus trituberculatus TaxID=210409 RepID=A0A5B7E1U1_PORTR|nr:hypothetical protein [Portunus trituberculatus]
MNGEDGREGLTVPEATVSAVASPAATRCSHRPRLTGSLATRCAGSEASICARLAMSCANDGTAQEEEEEKEEEEEVKEEEEEEREEWQVHE